MDHYNVILEKNVVGSVKVTRQGLYSRFHCACTLPDAGIYKLIVCSDDRRTNLGILVPQGSCFGLDTKIPRKNLGEGTLSFVILSAYGQSEDIFVPVKPGEPFVYLQMLDSAHAEMRGGNFGIVLHQAGST